MNVFGGPHTPEKLMASRDQGGYGLGGVAMQLRKECVADPLVLCRDVLSYKRDRTYWANPTVEHRAAAKCMKDQESFLLLMPRNHGKTSLVDEGGTVHQLLEYPDDRILCAQATDQNAVAISKQIREHFVSNRALREVFPEYAMEGEHNVKSWSVPCKQTISREGSVEVASPGTSLAGRHYTGINGSDLMNEQICPPPAGVGSHEEMEKVSSWFGTLSFLLDRTNPRSWTRLDGTRYHDMDLYGRIIRKARMRVIKCGIADDAEGRPVPIWDKMPRKALEDLRSEPLMSVAKWASQMKNEPHAGDDVGFSMSWFKPYRRAPIGTVLPEGVYLLPQDLPLRLALTLDPAFTEQDKNPDRDRSALVVSGVSPDTHGGNLYIPDWRAGRWTPRELMEQTYELYGLWHPEWVGLETGTQSVALKAMFLEDFMRGRPWLPLRDMPPKGQNKTVRAMPLRAWAERKWVYITEKDYEERERDGGFVNEFVRFPVGEHDDLVDALAYRALDLLMPHYQAMIQAKRATHIEVPAGMPGEELIRRLHDPEYSSPWFADYESHN